MYLKKVLNLLIILGVVSFSVSGCVKKEGKSVVTLRWVTNPNPVRKEQIEVFEKLNPGIKINMDWATRQAGHQKVITQIIGGTPPDLIDVSSPEILKIYARKGVLLELTSYCEKYNIDLSIFWPQCGICKFGCGNRMYWDNGLYAFPCNACPIVMFYNKKLFDEAGISYPKEDWTWSDALEIAKNLTAIEPGKKIYKHFGLCYGSLGYGNFASLFWQFGAKFYSPDGKKCIINSQEGKKALRFLYDLTYKYHVVPKAKESMAGAGVGHGSQDLDLFCAEKFAMMPDGRWAIISLRKVKNLDWDIAPLPKAKHKATYFVSRTTAIPKTSKHHEEAFQFLKYLTGNEYNKLLSHSGDGVPAVMSIAKSDIFLFDPAYPNERNNQVYIDEIASARVEFISPYVSGFETDRIWGMELDLMWIQKQTPEETLDNIAQQINALIEKE